MGEKFIANIDIPENDSLISAAWFGDGCLSDGSIFVTPNPVAVSSAVKKCSPAKPKTGREDSSSSLGILSPNTFAGTSRQLIQDDFLNLDLAPEVDVDQGELDELVASFESNACANDDSLMGSDGKATHVEQDFSDAERTLKAAQQFCTPISHLQPQSSTGKDSVLKITDTVYKRKKPKGVQLAEVKSKPQLPFGCRNTLSELPVVSGTSELSPEQNIADFNEEFVCGKVLNVKLLYPDVFEKPTRVKHMQDVVQELKFDNFGKLALLKEAEDSFLPGGPNFTFETNSGFDCGYLQAHSDSVPAPRFLRSKFDFMDHLSEDGESPCMRLTVNVLPENTKSLPDENAEDGQKKCWSGNVSRENEDGIPDCMSLAGTKKVSESPPNAMRLVKFQGSQQLQHSEIHEEKDALAISTWLSGDEPSSKLELSPWARNLLDCTGPNNATRLAEWILKSNESLAARINPSGKTASKSPFENRNDGLKQKKPRTAKTAVSSSDSLFKSLPRPPMRSNIVQLEAGKRCLSFGCLNIGERAYCSVPLRCRDGYGSIRCKVQLRRASESFKIETMESGCLLLFNAGEIQQLTASFCPQSVGFHSGKIVFVIEPTAEEFKICLNGWGGRAYISVTDNGAGCLLGNSRAWTLKLFRLSEGRFTGTFCVRNGGQLPAFVKIVPFRDSQFREPINDQSISIQPSKFVLCPGEREEAKVLLTTANNPNSDLIFLGIFWGEEVLRRNLRAAQTRKGKIYHVHGINFGELFDGELRCPISAAHFTRCDEGGLFNMGLQINTIRVVPEVSKLDSTDSFSAMDVNDTCLH